MGMGMIDSSPQSYVAHPSFKKPKTEALLFGKDINHLVVSTNRWHTFTTTTGKNTQNKSKKVEVMTRDEERLMFLRYNYAKFRLEILQRCCIQEKPTKKVLEEIDLWEQRVAIVRDYIVNKNIALVVKMIQKFRPYAEKNELFSEANVALLRAVEKFDVRRGSKFSTYAYQAIIKALSRYMGRLRQYQKRNRDIEKLTRPPEIIDWRDAKRSDEENLYLERLKKILNNNRAGLSSTELEILQLRFGFNQPDGKTHSLQEIGVRFNVTRERIRQIQKKIMWQLRRHVVEKI